MLNTNKIIIMIIPILIIILTCCNSTNYVANRGNKKGSITYAIYSNGKIIDSGNTIKQRNINHNLEMTQNLSSSSEYLLLVLIDYIPTNFYHNGIKLSKLNFSMNSQDKKTLNIKFNIPENSKDLCYLIIKRPDYFIEDKDIGKALSLADIITLRYNLDIKEKKPNISKNVNTTSDGLITEVFISKNKNKLKALFECNEAEKIYLTIGNTKNELQTVGVIKLLDWEPIKFQDKLVNFYKINPCEKITIDETCPEVKKDSLLQYIYFPYAYNISRENFYSTISYATNRLIVRDVD